MSERRQLVLPQKQGKRSGEEREQSVLPLLPSLPTCFIFGQVRPSALTIRIRDMMTTAAALKSRTGGEPTRKRGAGERGD